MDSSEGITNLGFAKSESWSANGLSESSSVHNHQIVNSVSGDERKSYAGTFSGHADTDKENLSSRYVMLPCIVHTVHQVNGFF